MVSTFKKLDRDQLEMLLWVYGNLDMVFDEGMTMEEDIEATLKRALFWVFKALRDYEKKTGYSESKQLFIAYIDHFNRLIVLGSGNQSPDELKIELKKKLQSERRINSDIMELEKTGDYFSKTILIADLEVFNEFLGAIVLTGSGLTGFHKRFISLVAEKIDTDIYQHNRLTLEQLKNQGIEEINNILDSSMPLHKKYQKVMRLLVESIGAYSGHLVIPREGKLKLSNQFISNFETSILKREDLIELAEKTIKRNETGRFLPIEGYAVEEGQILSTLLKPNQDQVEGIIILHHPDFKKGHAEVADAYSNLIDSTLHVNQLYAGIFENFLTAFGVIVDTFDNFPSGRSYRRSHYAMALGKALGLSKLEMTRLRIASMIYDLDKVGIDPRVIRKRARMASRGFSRLEGGSRVSEKMLDNLFPLDTKSFSSKFDFETDSVGEDIGGVISDSEKGTILAGVIRVADAFDSLTSDRPYKRGLNREAALESLSDQARSHSLPGEYVNLFKSSEIWTNIKHVFQAFKIEQAVNWYKKSMIPEMAAINKELETVKSSLNEIRHIRSQFERGKEINLGLIEDTLLSPSEKDLLIQREAQKNPSAYNRMLKDMENRFKDKLNNLEAKRKMESRFRDKFWDPEILGEITHNLLELNDRNVDFFEQRTDLDQLLPNHPCSKESFNLIEMVECLLGKSFHQKGLNRAFQEPLKKLLKASTHLMDAYFD